MAILLVEQHVDLVLRVADYVYVLDRGQEGYARRGALIARLEQRLCELPLLLLPLSFTPIDPFGART